MYDSRLLPLRRIVGGALSIENASVLRVSSDFPSGEAVSVQVVTGVNNLTASPAYGQFLPKLEALGIPAPPSLGSGTVDVRLSPVPEAATFPVRTEITELFGFTPRFIQAHWLAKSEIDTPSLARKLWCEIVITLPRDRRVIGGICYSGFPYLPHVADETGANRSNWGLPHELSVTWRRGDDELYLDAETTFLNQEPISHGGLHLLRIGPVAHTGGQIILRIADFPRILTRVTYRVEDGDLVRESGERWGFLLPFIAIFEYREYAKREAIVSTGLLTVRQPRVEAYAPHDVFLSPTGGESWLVGQMHDVGSTETRRNLEGVYLPLSAAAPIARPRAFAGALDEFFMSNTLAPEQSVVFYLEQAEEYDRCVAGLHIQFGGSRLPPLEGLATDLRIAAYELDPIEGMSPHAVALRGKYASLLGTTTVAPNWAATIASERTVKLRFVRPTNCRFIALEITNIGAAAGFVALGTLVAVRSVDVTVKPRPSRHLQIQAMHFRLIGAHLGEDYSRLGRDQFSFSVERIRGGEAKNVLFDVHCLADLLQSGVARLHANSRRRAVELERVDVDRQRYGPNEETRETSTRSGGWRKGQTGFGTDDDAEWDAELSEDADAYEAIANQEVRAHVRHLFPSVGGDASVDWHSAGAFLNALYGVFKIGDVVDTALSPGQLNNLFRIGPLFTVPAHTELHQGWARPWSGIIDPTRTESINRLRVHGLKNFQQSPYGPTAISGQFLHDLFTGTDAALRLMGDLAGGRVNFLDVGAVINALAPLGNAGGLVLTLIAAIVGQSSGGLAAIPLLNGLTLGISAQPAGLGLSFGSPPLLPGVVETASVGDAGTVTLQASSTGYSFAKHRSEGFDRIRSTSTVTKAVSQRRVERREVDGTDALRIRGSDVMWQGEITDVLTGTIPIGLTLSATNSKMYRTADEWIRVRLGGGAEGLASVDVWFDVLEEVMRDDD